MNFRTVVSSVPDRVVSIPAACRTSDAAELTCPLAVLTLMFDPGF